MRALAACAALVSLSGNALAQAPPPSATSPVPPSFPLPHPGFAPPYGWPPPGTAPVIIQGDRPGYRFSVSLEKDQHPFAYCPHDCTLQLRPGEYWLKVHQGPGTIEGQRRFEIEGPARARVVPRTEDERSSGMTMGYVGIGLLAGGVAASLWGLGEAIDGDEDRASWLLLLGVGGIISGSILTPIGFVRGGRSAPRIDVQPLAPRSTTHEAR